MKDRYLDSLAVICGPMFSGKSSWLLAENEKFEDVEIYRFSTEPVEEPIKASFATHNNKEFYAYKINYFTQIKTDCKTIFIDEAQFSAIWPDAEPLKELFQIGEGKNVYLAGLDLDWQDQPFEIMTKFMGYASDVVKLKARCWRCEAPARFSEKINPDKRKYDEFADYKPICSKCRRAALATINQN